MDELPEWMYAPRVEGWFAEDLDHLPDAPKHTELIDGALVFRSRPQSFWHSHVGSQLTAALDGLVPAGQRATGGMTITLDRRSRLDSDVLVTDADFDPDRTWFAPGEVPLVVEVVSPESAHRDRTVKVRKYAEAGIPHYWIVEEEDGLPVVHVFELEPATSSYVPAGTFRGKLERPVPFPITIDLDGLVPSGRRAAD
ncbi:Uma2 family endonuclease [Kitasatospora sp. NPDC127121]|uniref:Uma2 family endonuclease n=1 Tax=Kitasatospora sp. NPDC127121 TaxID=3345371 RepID=UPI0036369627